MKKYQSCKQPGFEAYEQVHPASPTANEWMSAGYTLQKDVDKYPRAVHS
jgi:hypothetical protein